MHLFENLFFSGVLNDLDLTLHGNEKVFYPNGLVNGPDTLNNAERVIIEKPTNGTTYSIRVFGSNLLDDQVNARNRGAASIGTIPISLTLGGSSFLVSSF
jgi:hypothetical protein